VCVQGGVGLHRTRRQGVQGRGQQLPGWHVTLSYCPIRPPGPVRAGAGAWGGAAACTTVQISIGDREKDAGLFLSAQLGQSGLEREWGVGAAAEPFRQGTATNGTTSTVEGAAWAAGAVQMRVAPAQRISTRPLQPLRRP